MYFITVCTSVSAISLFELLGPDASTSMRVLDVPALPTCITNSSLSRVDVCLCIPNVRYSMQMFRAPR